jgi:endonuclease-3
MPCNGYHSSVRIKEIISRLKKRYPNAKTALNFSNPLEMLVATILSAQCRDALVNIVTEKLFKKYRSVSDYAQVQPKELEQDIIQIGFYSNKAKHIINAAKLILQKHNGKVPSEMNLLLELPGVGRKTANVVLGNSFGIVEGIVVDTHVLRISYLLGLTKNKNPERVEQDLMAIIPRAEWFHFSHLLQAHGRTICIARRPQHSICPLDDICPRG